MLLNKSYFQAIAICVLALIQIPAVLSIAGGADGVQADLKYVVKVTVNDLYACGGALVSPTHVVTVYHCVLGVDKAKVKVEGGTIDSTVTPANLLAVAEIYRSPHFNAFTRYMDIAVLKLAAAVANANMAPISLCEIGWGLQTPITISGWGLMANGDAATKLQTAKVTAIPNSECGSAFGGAMITENMVCALSSAPAKMSKGDDGATAEVNGKLCALGLLPSNGMDPKKPDVLMSINGCKNFLVESMKL